MGQRRRAGRVKLPPMIAVDDRYAGGLADALMFMRARIDAPPRLDEIAAIAGFSPFHFHRIFKAATGEGPSEFIVRHRLERAAFELRSTRQRIIAIATRCGYETPSAFARAFAARFGMSPSAFRADASAVRAHAPLYAGEPHGEMRIETYPPYRLLGLRHVGPYTEVAPTWAALRDVAGGVDSPARRRGSSGSRTTTPRSPATSARYATTPASPCRPERRPVNSSRSRCPAGATPYCGTADPTK